MDGLRRVRERWPEPEVPEGEPLWLLYEIDGEADSVIRTVHVFPDGQITRNSIEIEERNGHPCPSLIDTSLADGFGDADLNEISIEEFNEVWAMGVDKPIWDPC